ncbi:MAG TPA: hypothetical protein VLR94_07680, partial [Acidobacteriota bacterium]|nr:hypothetical protein [Acidobacteriota bacterium]
RHRNPRASARTSRAGEDAGGSIMPAGGQRSVGVELRPRERRLLAGIEIRGLQPATQEDCLLRYEFLNT